MRQKLSDGRRPVNHAYAIAGYRDRYQITDERDVLGPQPRDLTQRRNWRDCQQSIERVRTQGGVAEEVLDNL